MSEGLTVTRLMAIEPIRKILSLKCERCSRAGAPLRVESQTNTTLVLAFHCQTCATEWTTEAVLPVFLAWVKPDRRQRIRPGGSPVCADQRHSVADSGRDHYALGD